MLTGGIYHVHPVLSYPGSRSLTWLSGLLVYLAVSSHTITGCLIAVLQHVSILVMEVSLTVLKFCVSHTLIFQIKFKISLSKKLTEI